MNKYILDEINKYKKVKGIYALVYNNEIVYIGQSTNIANRLKAHRKDTNYNDTLAMIKREKGKVNRSKQLALYEFIGKHKEDMYFNVLEETEELNKREEYYITLYKPQFNYKGVDIPY